MSNIGAPYSPDDGNVTCRTFYVTLKALKAGDEIFTDYGNKYSSIHLDEVDTTVNKACKSCEHRLKMGCEKCKALKCDLEEQLKLRGVLTEMYEARLATERADNNAKLAKQVQASRETANSVREVNRNRLTRPAGQKLREEAARLRGWMLEADTQRAAQRGTIAALEAKLATAEAAAERYNEVREVFEATNEERIGNWWDTELFEQIDNYVQGGRDVVELQVANKLKSERVTRTNRNKSQSTQRHHKERERFQVLVKGAKKERKRVAQ